MVGRSLRIHFTARDLEHLCVASAPDPLWETVFSLHRLQTRDGYGAFDLWHHRVRLELRRRNLDDLVRGVLLPLVPRAAYFPDFLTPAAGHTDAAAAVDAVMSTPPGRIRRELGELGKARRLPGWADDLAAGRPAAVRSLGDALLRYYRVAVAPYWPRASGRVAVDRALRGYNVLNGGLAALFAGLSPYLAWQPPVLTVLNYPRDGDVYLGGRGLTLVPAYFCWGTPVALADDELPPVLLYPALVAQPAAEVASAEPLRGLIGATRVAILHAVAHGRTTTDLARLLSIAPATASHHTAVLRRAGLISSQREANMMLHMVTPLGRALLAQTVSVD
jgi:DNA-binding transcriptional ArsR family regulator